MTQREHFPDGEPHPEIKHFAPGDLLISHVNGLFEAATREANSTNGNGESSGIDQVTAGTYVYTDLGGGSEFQCTERILLCSPRKVKGVSGTFKSPESPKRRWEGPIIHVVRPQNIIDGQSDPIMHEDDEGGDERTPRNLLIDHPDSFIIYFEHPKRRGDDKHPKRDEAFHLYKDYVGSARVKDVSNRIDPAVGLESTLDQLTEQLFEELAGSETVTEEMILKFFQDQSDRQWEQATALEILEFIKNEVNITPFTVEYN